MIDLALEQVFSKSVGLKDISLYVETSDIVIRNVAGKPVYFPGTELGYTGKLVFFKYYDPYTTTLEYVFSSNIPSTMKIADIVPQLIKSKNLPVSSKLILFEEVKPGMIDFINPELTFNQADIGVGDIICFQVEVDPKSMDLFADPTLATAPGYYESLSNKVTVVFKPKTNKGKDIELELSKKMTYDDVSTFNVGSR